VWEEGGRICVLVKLSGICRRCGGSVVTPSRAAVAATAAESSGAMAGGRGCIVVLFSQIRSKTGGRHGQSRQGEP